MILKRIYLQIDDVRETEEFRYAFLTTSRYFCTFVERECLDQLRPNCGEFNRIVVCLNTRPSPEPVINTERALVVDLIYNRHEIEDLTGSDLTHYQINVLKNGFGKINRFTSIPILELNSCLDRFIKAGFINSWIHQQKASRAHGVVATLVCQMTQTEFLLRLIIHRGPKAIYDRKILKTNTDTLSYHYEFNDIKFDKSSVVITRKHGKPLKTVNIPL